MKLRTIVIAILSGLFLVNAALLVAGAQYVPPAADQFTVNQPLGTAQPGSIFPSAGMMPGANAVPYAGTGVPYGAFDGSGLASYGGCGAPLAAPLAAPCVTPCVAPAVAAAPFTSGFTYSASQSSAFGPFTPPVSQATEQYYQYPGLTPFGAYPGAGYSAVGGVGFDPLSGYYGPYGAVAPIA